MGSRGDDGNQRAKRSVPNKSLIHATQPHNKANDK